MSAYDFFGVMGDLHSAGRWAELECLLAQPHPLLPGEREAFIELAEVESELGVQPCVRLDESGMHVVPL